MWTAAVFAGIVWQESVSCCGFCPIFCKSGALARGLDRRQPAEAARYGLRLQKRVGGHQARGAGGDPALRVEFKRDSCPRDRKRRTFMGISFSSFVTVLFFAISIAYTYFCERMR